MDSQVVLKVKNLPANAEDIGNAGLISRSGRSPGMLLLLLLSHFSRIRLYAIPWNRAWQTTPAFLPGEAHGQRSLAGHSAWGHTESDTTEVT